MACILMILYGVVDGYPIVVAANRDESYDRGNIAPNLIDKETIETDVKVWAPRDAEKKGSWIGVNEHGLLVALTNRLSDRSGEGYTSRGQLVLRALSKNGIFSVEELIKDEIRKGQYAPFNLVYANGHNAYVRQYTQEGLSDPQELGEGINVLTSSSINDRGNPRSANAFGLLGGIEDKTVEPTIGRLMQICTDEEAGILVRGKKAGTVASVIFAVGHHPLENRCFYAEHIKGSVGKFRDYSGIFRK